MSILIEIQDILHRFVIDVQRSPVKKTQVTVDNYPKIKIFMTKNKIFLLVIYHPTTEKGHNSFLEQMFDNENMC